MAVGPERHPRSTYPGHWTLAYQLTPDDADEWARALAAAAREARGEPRLSPNQHINLGVVTDMGRIAPFICEDDLIDAAPADDPHAEARWETEGGFAPDATGEGKT